MTKQQLTDYITEAVDAMDEEDLTLLFPAGNQPDLFTIVNELIGLKGLVKQLVQASLKLNNKVEQTQQANDQFLEKLSAKLISSSRLPDGEKGQSGELQTKLLLSIVHQDEIYDRTMAAFKNLPEIHLITWLRFKAAFQTWSEGYLMAQQQWSQLLDVLELEKTGLAGEIFDAKEHQATAVKYDASQPENTILETEAIGYLYQNKVLKTAKVIVNKKNEQKRNNSRD